MKLVVFVTTKKLIEYSFLVSIIFVLFAQKKLKKVQNVLFAEEKFYVFFEIKIN